MPGLILFGISWFMPREPRVQNISTISAVIDFDVILFSLYCGPDMAISGKHGNPAHSFSIPAPKKSWVYLIKGE